LRSDDEFSFVDPTGEVPVVSTTDSRVTISGAEIAADAADGPVIDPTTLLPHWTDAPTGQVPIVVAREAAESDDPWSAVPAPAWREGEADWVAHEGQFDASILAGDDREDTARPWEFTLPDDDIVVEEAVLDEAPRPEPQRVQRTRRSVTSNPLAGRAVRQRTDRNVSRATLTGVLLAIAVGAVFYVGVVPTAAMVLVVLGLASAEAYAGFRSVGAHPASVLGIVAVLTLGFSVYQKGVAAYGAVSVLLLVLGFVWYLNAHSVDVLDGLGATMFVYAWVGVLGSYALLMISPNSFPQNHGIAFLFGAVLLTVANDSGALFIGRRFGKQPLNQALSPNKTRGGAIGGTVVPVRRRGDPAPDEPVDEDPRPRGGGRPVGRRAPGGPLRVDGEAHPRREGPRTDPARPRRPARPDRRTLVRAADHVLPHPRPPTRLAVRP